MTKITTQKIKILLGVLLFSVVYCNGNTVSNTNTDTANKPQAEININEFIAAHKSDENIKVLDVRESNEYASGHVPKAKPAPLSEIKNSANIEKLIPFSKEDKIYVICRSGKRSMAALQIMRGFGYSNSVSVRGGTLAWIDAGNEIEK